jgi:hypothetical protein
MSTLDPTRPIVGDHIGQVMGETANDRYARSMRRLPVAGDGLRGAVDRVLIARPGLWTNDLRGDRKEAL